MNVLVELIVIVVAAILASRLLQEPWKGRVLNTIKAVFTFEAFRLLLSHPVKMDDGSEVVAWRLILQTLENIDAATFWWFVFLAAGIKFLGILASMTRWLVLLRGQGIELPFRHIFGSFLIGRFIGTFLPSTAGLDGYKLYDASRFSGRTVETTAATFLEKILGVSGIFLTYLVALPFGIEVLEQFLGDNTTTVAGLSVLIASGIIGGLLLVLWFPGIVQWLLETLPIPGKQRLEGIVTRLSNASAAYRGHKLIVVQALVLSFLVHFTTAAMYYFTALAIGASHADFWQVTFGSSIQILATVLSPITIAGEGIREAAQYLLLSKQLGAGNAIVSAALGFWAAEALTLAGGFFWWIRPKNYTPAFCRVNGVQVDYEEAARSAAAIETEEEKARHDREFGDLPPMGARVFHCAGLGFGGGVLAGVIVGILESLVIASGGFGAEAQVLWYGPLIYAAIFSGLGALGGVVLGVLPMDREEANGWVPSLAILATLVPFGLAITVFRLRRDVYLEQMPPAPVLLGTLAVAGAIALFLFLVGPKIFRSGFGSVAQPIRALIVLFVAMALGGVSAVVFGPDAGAAPHQGGVPSQLAERPNVLLIMVDTLRADRLSCYGYEGIETPNICSLAEDGGSRFQGFAHSSWTKPSTATLLTSLLPASHNAMSKPSKLSPDVEMISEVLKTRGYTTGGIVSNINLAESFGFDQGYDEYHYLGPDYLAYAEESSSKLIIYNIVRAVWFKLNKGMRFGDFYQDSEVVNEVAFDWMNRHKDDRFFLFLHYMDVHDPYFEHPYNGNAVARVSNQNPDAELAEEMHQLYLGEIEYLDANVGRLIAEMKRLGIYDDTVIALVADHGEEFQEHGGWWHGLTLYDEQIHVPYLIKWPKGQSAPPRSSLDELARVIDLAPTLIATTGAEVPSSMQGLDLMGDATQRAEKDRQVYAEEDHEGIVLSSLRTKSMKLIKANPGNHRGLAETELYNVQFDEGETKNLAGGSHAQEEAELARHAELQLKAAQGKAVASAGDADMSREECEQLLNLGYLEDCSHIQ